MKPLRCPPISLPAVRARAPLSHPFVVANCASRIKCGVAALCASLRSTLGHERLREMGQDNDMALVAAGRAYAI